MKGKKEEDAEELVGVEVRKDEECADVTKVALDTEAPKALAQKNSCLEDSQAKSTGAEETTEASQGQEDQAKEPSEPDSEALKQADKERRMKEVLEVMSQTNPETLPPADKYRFDAFLGDGKSPSFPIQQNPNFLKAHTALS